MAVTKQILEAWAKSKGWSEDRWGHLRKSSYRIKLSRIAARYELRSPSGWIRLRSAYYHSIEITPEGKLKGLMRGGCGYPIPQSGIAPTDDARINQPTAIPQGGIAEESEAMKKTFAITPENEVIVYASLKEAHIAHGSKAAFFADIDGLATATAEWPGSRLVDLWNSIPGNSEVKKFMDRKTALRRIWNAIQTLNDGQVPATPEAKVEEPTTEQPAPEKKERKAKKADAEPKQPRDTKKAKVMEMIARAEGATNQEIQEATEWQAHTIRGFLSIAKKRGANIETIKRADETRAYHLAQ
jgi:hypothetical protein